MVTSSRTSWREKSITNFTQRRGHSIREQTVPSFRFKPFEKQIESPRCKRHETLASYCMIASLVRFTTLEVFCSSNSKTRQWKSFHQTAPYSNHPKYRAGSLGFPSFFFRSARFAVLYSQTEKTIGCIRTESVSYSKYARWATKYGSVFYTQ